MIPNELLIDWCLVQSSERFHSATDLNRCREPKSNIRQCLGNPREEGEEEL